MDARANIGVIGGSGFYRFLEDVEEIEIDTPYGRPSDKITLAAVGDKKVAFIPRHGKDHRFPPHMAPYRANIFAMKQLRVKHIIAPCACGSLQSHIKPGDFVVCDQFIDRTSGRKDTFFDGPEVKHKCYLALEMEIPYVNISIVTDYDTGLEGRDDIKPVTIEAALKTFYENVDKVKNLICRIYLQQ